MGVTGYPGQVATPAEYAAAHFAERLVLVPGSFFINEYAKRCIYIYPP